VLAKIDAWAAGQEDKPPRTEAIRRLVEQALAAAESAQPAAAKPAPASKRAKRKGEST
jgi:hypothetical protein